MPEDSNEAEEQGSPSSRNTLQIKPLTNVANKPAAQVQQRAAPMPQPNRMPPAFLPGQATCSTSTQELPAQPPGGIVLPTQMSPSWPVLHMIPLNDTFIPKQVYLGPPGTRIKIGRQTNAKTVPAPNNGYFDSKVLSRMHAELWFDAHQEGSQMHDTPTPSPGKVFIKDVGSSNGTFINGERLSLESIKSDVFELHTEDTVEFGIDIASEDNRTILHHKVAAKVHLALTQEDAMTLSRQLSAYHQKFNAEVGMRRMSRAGVASTGLSFDHVLSRLQSELQKSRETGQELSALTTSMNDVHATLGGHISTSHLPTTFPRVPPVNANPQHLNGQMNGNATSNANLTALQTQLNDTQANFASHVDKIKQLEGLLDQHSSVKQEVEDLKEQMRIARSELEILISTKQSHLSSNPLMRSTSSGIPSAIDMDRINNKSSTGLALVLDPEDTPADDEDDMDDSRSIASIATIKGPPADLEETEFDFSDSDAFQIKREFSPKLNGILSHPSKEDEELKAQNAELKARLEELSSDFQSATQLAQTLKEQHAEAAELMRRLEERIVSLETEAAMQTQIASQPEPVIAKKAVNEDSSSGFQKALALATSAESGTKLLQDKWEAWKDTIEASWRKDRQDWEDERGKLREIIAQWEVKEADRQKAQREMQERLQAEIEGLKGAKRRSRSRRKRRAVNGINGLEGHFSGSSGESASEDSDKEMAESPVDSMRSGGRIGTSGSVGRRNTITGLKDHRKEPVSPASKTEGKHTASKSREEFEAFSSGKEEDVTLTSSSSINNGSDASNKSRGKKHGSVSNAALTTVGAISVVAVALATYHVLSTKD